MRFTAQLAKVFEQLCTGKSEKEIARALKMNAYTLHSHTKRVYRLLENV